MLHSSMPHDACIDTIVIAVNKQLPSTTSGRTLLQDQVGIATNASFSSGLAKRMIIHSPATLAQECAATTLRLASTEQYVVQIN